MEKERRKAERLQVKLDARWESILARRDGTIVDVSREGCFILTSDNVQPRELIRLEIVTPDGGRVFLWGEVIYQVHEMGFALRFTHSDEGEHEIIDLLMKSVRDNKAGVERGL